MSFRLPLVFLFTLFISASAWSQATCTTLGQTPETAFPVCGTGTFSQTRVPTCGGRTIPGPCSGVADVNPFWYRFTCYTAGTLGFTITPVQMSDDYDWHIFDVTGVTNPQQVYTDPTLFVACNWSGDKGITGTSVTAVDLIECAGGTPKFSRMPTLIAGHTYLMVVSNFSASQQGYTLQFDAGTAVITDPVAPQIVSATPNCDGTRVVLRFNKKMKCSSLTVSGSDFTVSGGASIGSATGLGCTSSFDLDSVALNMTVPLTPGTYTVSMSNGTDGNTLLDNCSTPIPTGDNVSFTINPAAPLPMGTVTPPGCTPTTISVSFPENINCNSLAANGSDFTITGPSPVTVTGATATCTGGQSNTVVLQLSAPILTPGAYQVQINTGSDGNTLSGNCNRMIAAGGTAGFSIAPQPPLAMGTIAPPSCSPSSVTLTLPENIFCASIAANGSDFQVTGPAPVTVSGATANCTNGQSNTVTIQFSAPITVAGNYQLVIASGSDGNTLAGECSRMLAAGASAGFAIPDVPPVAMGTIDAVACAPATLTLRFPEPVKCTSIAANGSDFVLSGPSAVTITGATGSCDGNGLARNVTLQLSSPIGTGGNYQVQLVSGSDGNTVLSECNRPSVAGAVALFTATDTVSAEFQYAIQYDCQEDEITFTHDGAHGVSQWNWTINGTAAGNQPSFVRSFSASSTNRVQLTVSNGVCSDTYSTTIVLDNKIIAAFEAPADGCPREPIAIAYTGAGPVDSWQWDFGNGNTSDQQNPPAQVYPQLTVDQNYTIRLRIGNQVSGCHTEVSQTIKILSTCRIEVPSGFTPNNDGINDFFYPLNAFKADNLDFKVYNRWGQVVFYAKDAGQRWNGKLKGVEQATGIYVWQLNYTDRDTGEKISKKGTVLLLR